MQRLALRKYDEIAAMNSLPGGQDEGDFQDIDETRFVWRAQRTSLGQGSLDELRVEVARRGTEFAQSTQIHGLLCRKPEKSR